MTPRPAPSVAGVVLAAGRSSRMGRPKPLLEVEGSTFLERAIETLADGGCAPVVVVVATDEDGRRARDLARAKGARIAENPDPGSEQVDSLLLGLGVIGAGPAAAVVLPVDHPLASATAVRAIVAAFHARGAPIVRPVYDREPGHPVLFARDLWAEFAATGLREGARDVLARHHDAIEDVPIDDPGVTVDVDTPEDLAREVEE